jgi:HAD superfamily hydrolase (TIGR01509 family)
LVLSEDLAFEGCADVLNMVFKLHGLNLVVTPESLISTYVGQNFRQMLTTILKEHNLEISPEETEKYTRMEEDAVIAKLVAAAKPCPGVDEQLERLASEGKYKMAIVSSSAFRRVRASVEAVGQAKYFAPEVTFSAATSLPKPTSKPDPAIYLHALKTLQITPEESIAIEDSRSGTLSATRAGIKVIGYTGPYPAELKGKMLQVLTEAGAVVIMDDWKDFPACLEKIESSTI